MSTDDMPPLSAALAYLSPSLVGGIKAYARAYAEQQTAKLQTQLDLARKRANEMEERGQRHADRADDAERRMADALRDILPEDRANALLIAYSKTYADQQTAELRERIKELEGRLEIEADKTRSWKRLVDASDRESL